MLPYQRLRAPSWRKTATAPAPPVQGSAGVGAEVAFPARVSPAGEQLVAPTERLEGSDYFSSLLVFSRVNHCDLRDL